MEVKDQLHDPAAVFPGKEPSLNKGLGRPTDGLGVSREEESLASAENRNTVPRLPSP